MKHQAEGRYPESEGTFSALSVEPMNEALQTEATAQTAEHFQCSLC